LETVKDHYDRFLGSVYSWILGDFETARQKNTAYFNTLDLAPDDNAIAVDLGCGPGCQSLPLAELGYSVLAIDFCRELLDELGQRTGDLSIRTVCDDLLSFRSHMSEPADLIVCMGDTLVHLPDEKAVESVINDVCDSLKPGGTFIYAIRDYVDYTPQGAARFIPIRANDDQIFTCFLDYRQDVVHVHDVLYRRIDGEWRMRISDYLKLRLDTRRINEQMTSRGLIVAAVDDADGMITVIARRPE
jgi:SAM-dependent methyltransferase